jgi:nucleoside permease NupC
MKLGLGVDRVDCSNVKAIVHMKMFRNFIAMFKFDKVAFLLSYRTGVFVTTASKRFNINIFT